MPVLPIGNAFNVQFLFSITYHLNSLLYYILWKNKMFLLTKYFKYVKITKEKEIGGFLKWKN